MCEALVWSLVPGNQLMQGSAGLRPLQVISIGPDYYKRSFIPSRLY